MADLNKVFIRGRLGANPEIRYTQSNTPVANFSLATGEKYKNKAGELVENTEWHRVVAWNRLAEIVDEYLQKGDMVFIEGKIQTREWEDKDGVKRYTTEVVALRLDMLSTKGDKEQRPESNSKANDGVDLDDEFDDMDDDLPF